MKNILLIASLLLVQFTNATDSLTVKNNEVFIQKNEQKIDILEKQLENYKDALLSQTIASYNQTNDRINNYLTFTTIIATIFGVIIAIGGVFIGFEGIKSQRRRQEAIKTLEEAKKYVEDRKTDFDKTINDKLVQLESEYQKILTLSKERLLDDVNAVTQKVKVLAEKKSQEIEDFSIEEKTDKVLESLQSRIDFFESIGIPDDPKILMSKAKILSEKGMHNESIELLEKLIDIEPKNSSAFWRLGWEYSKLDRHSDSIRNYKTCIELNPKNASAHNNLAVELERTDKPYDALQYYGKAIELDNSSKLYYKNKAKILVKLNSIDEAYLTYKELLKLDNKDENSYNIVLKFLLDQSRFDDAIEIYDLAILNIADKKQEFDYSKAIVLRELKRYDEAITIFQNLIDLNHKAELCYLQIAEIKNNQGLKDDAIEILNSAIISNPKNSSLYIRKAGFQIIESEQEALKTIEDGAIQIEGEKYFQLAGRYFAKNNYTDFSKKLYEKANSIMKDKLPEKKESNILEYYEGLVITDCLKDAKEFIKEYESIIVSAKYIIVNSFINLCIDFVNNEENKISGFLVQAEKLISENEFIKTGWNFEDILYWSKAKIGNLKYEKLYAISKLLEGELTLEETKQRVQ